MKKFNSPQMNEIEELENQRNAIDRKIALIKKEPIVWLEDYFSRHPNIRIGRIYKESFLDSIVVEFLVDGLLPSFIFSDIMVGINYVVSEVSLKSTYMKVRFADIDDLVKHG